MNLLIILYFSLNFLITLIWWIIPSCINHLRNKRYGLPPKMVLWPIKVSAFRNDVVDLIVPTTITGVLVAVPAIIIYVIYKVLYKCIISMAFSKEEKVQIAVGAISKKE